MRFAKSHIENNFVLKNKSCAHGFQLFTFCFLFFIRFHKIDFYLGHKEEGAGKREKSKKWFLFLGKLMVIIYFGYLGVKFTFWIKISLDWVTQNDMTILSLSLSLLFLIGYKYMEWTKVKSSIVGRKSGVFCF